MIVLCFAPYIGNWKQAEERFKESLELTPNQATTYNNLGKESLYNETGIHGHSALIVPTASLYGETKRYKESEEMFRKALELNPTYVEAYFNLGWSMQLALISIYSMYEWPRVTRFWYSWVN